MGGGETYAEFHAAVEKVARGLLALGIEPGERVGIWSPNNAEWVTLQYATAKVGASQSTHWLMSPSRIVRNIS